MKLFFLLLALTNLSNGYAQNSYRYQYLSFYSIDGKSLKVKSDGTMLVSGQYQDLSSSTAGSFIAKLNSQGDVIWTEAIANYKDSRLAEFDNGDILFVAQSYNSSLGIAVIRMNQAGGIIWQKEFKSSPPNGRINFPDATIAEDGSILIVGNSNSNVCILKIDGQGSLIWSNQVSGLGMTSVSGINPIGQIIESLDGGYIVANRGEGGGNTGTDAMIFKLDSLGQVLWLNFIGETYTQSFRRVIQLPSGSIYAMGSDLDATGDLLITKLNSQGNIEWSKKYNGGQKELGAALLYTNPNELTISGSYIPPWSGATIGAFMTKIDTSGVVITSYQTSDIIIIVDASLTLNNQVVSVGTGKQLGNQNNILELIKTNSFGALYCNNQNYPLTVLEYNSPIVNTYEENGPCSSWPLSLPSSPFGLTKEVVCASAVELEEQYFPFEIRQVLDYIEIENPDEIMYSVEIYNMQGQLIHDLKNNTNNSHKILINDLDDGIYIYHLSYAETRRVGKFFLN